MLTLTGQKAAFVHKSAQKHAWNAKHGVMFLGMKRSARSLFFLSSMAIDRQNLACCAAAFCTIGHIPTIRVFYVE